MLFASSIPVVDAFRSIDRLPVAGAVPLLITDTSTTPVPPAFTAAGVWTAVGDKSTDAGRTDMVAAEALKAVLPFGSVTTGKTYIFPVAPEGQSPVRQTSVRAKGRIPLQNRWPANVERPFLLPLRKCPGADVPDAFASSDRVAIQAGRSSRSVERGT